MKKNLFYNGEENNKLPKDARHKKDIENYLLEKRKSVTK